MLVRPTTLLGILLGSAAPAQIGGPVRIRMATIDAVAVQDSGSSRHRMAGLRVVGQMAIGDAKARPSIAFAREIGAEKAIFQSARAESVARAAIGSSLVGTSGIDRLHRQSTGAALPNVAQLHAVAGRRTGPQVTRYASLTCVTSSV